MADNIPTPHTSVRLAGLLMVVAFLLAAEPVAAPPRLDALGDPLPPGVLARLGTGRLVQGDIDQVVFSPDGKTLAGHDGSGRVILWEVKTGRELHRIPAPHSPSRIPSPSRLVFAPDGKRLAFVCRDGTLRLFDPNTGQETAQALTKRGNYTRMAFAPDGKSLVLVGQGQALQVWNVEKQPAATFLGEPLPVSALAYSADGKTLTVLSHDPASPRKQTISLWDIPQGKEQRHTLEQESDGNEALAPDGRTLAMPVFGGKQILLLDPATGKELRRFSCPGAETDGGYPHRLHFSADAKGLAVVTLDGSVLVWSVETGKLRHQVKGPKARRPNAGSFAPDLSLVVYTSRSDQALHLLDLSRGTDLHTFAGHRAGPLTAVFGDEGKTVVTASSDWSHSVPSRPGALWSLRAWDSASGKEAHSAHQQPTSEVRWTAISPDGRQLALTLNDGKIQLWDVGRGQQRWQCQGPPPMGLPNICFTPDGKTLLALDDQKVHRWDTATGQPLPAFDLSNKAYFRRCLCHPDGQTLLVVDSAEVDNRVVLLDLRTGKETRRFSTRPGGVPTIALSPDGRTLALSSNSPNSLTLWETASGSERGRWEQGSLVAAFSPDGQFLVSGGARGELSLWHIPSGSQVIRAIDYPGWITSLAFSPDGSKLVVAGHHNTVLVCDVAALLGELPANRDPVNLDRLWEDLTGRNGSRAYQVVQRLASHGPPAVTFLREALQKVPAADPKRQARLIAELDDQEFAVREKTFQELERLSEQATPALEEALRGRPSAEVRNRVQVLLDRLKDKTTSLPSPELIALRVVEILERNGGREARQWLDELSRGANSRVAHETRTALERLTPRPKQAVP